MSEHRLINTKEKNMDFLEKLLKPETLEALKSELEGTEVKLFDLSTGDYVAKQKYETLQLDKKTMEEQLAQRDSDLEALKGTMKLNEDQLAKYNELQTKYTSEKEEWEQKYRDNERNSAFQLALAKSGAIDTVGLSAHIQSFAQEAEFKDGTIVGLQEHIKERLESDLAHYLPKEKADGYAGGKYNKNTVEETVMKQFGVK